MVAPTSVSALLHAVAVVKAGVFSVLRVILYVFGPDLLSGLDLWIILAYFASFTILLSGMLALAQDNLKRRLAFSTINNLAIIILGAALLSPSGITGGIFHIAAHGDDMPVAPVRTGDIILSSQVRTNPRSDGLLAHVEMG